MKTEVFRAYNVFIPGIKGYGLKQFSLSIYAGEILGVFGNNYAGRHLVFQLLQRKVSPDKGMVFWADTNDDDAVSSVLITNSSIMNDSLKIWENISLLWSTSSKTKKDSKKTRSFLPIIFERFGLNFNIDEDTRMLTPLQKIFLEILVAYQKGAKLIILDLNGVEAKQEEYIQLKELFRKLQEKTVSFVLFSFNTNVISNLAERIAILHKGRIVKTIEDLSVNSGELDKCFISLYREEEVIIPRAADRESLLTIDGLEIGFSKPVSISLNRGEFTLISCSKLDLFQVLSDGCSGENRQSATIVYKGNVCNYLQKEKDVIFLDSRYLDTLIEEMSPLDNLCLGISEKTSRIWNSDKVMKCLEEDFYEWYGHNGMLRQKNSYSLFRKDRAAINLFRLRYFNASLIICNDFTVYNDVVVCTMVQQFLAELVKKGAAVCITTGDLFQKENLAYRYINLDKEGYYE